MTDRTRDLLDRLSVFYGGARARFVQHKAWLGNEDAMAAGALLRLRAAGGFPGFPPRRLLQLWMRTFAAERIEVPTSAEAIQVNMGGTRLRAFDAGRKRSFKIVVEDSRYGAGTLREMEVRRDRLPGSGIPFPAVIGLQQQDGCLFLEEELIPGRSWNIRRDGAALEQAVVAPLRRLYAHSGITRTPLTDLQDPARMDAALEADASIPLVAHLQGLIGRNPLVAAALCHGDLCPSNMAVSDQGVVFLDWEQAREDVLGSDLTFMAVKYSGNRSMIAATRSLLRAEQGDTLNFADIMALRFLRDRSRLGGDWAKLSQRWSRIVAA